MRARKTFAFGLGTLLLLQGCAMTPSNPTVAVLPGAGKSFDAFAADQAVCKQYASAQVAGQAQQANNLGVGTAVLGTVLGAGLGAAIGGGNGAGIGAAAGALGGTSVGAAGTANAQLGIQQQYDIAYEQCMYAKGNQVPGPAAYPAPAPYPAYPAPDPYAAPPGS
jgi:hypothetical protein